LIFFNITFLFVQSHLVKQEQVAHVWQTQNWKVIFWFPDSGNQVATSQGHNLLHAIMHAPLPLYLPREDLESL
jgi:hypothetical protein